MSAEPEWPFDIKPPIHYANSQWVVTDFGLECLWTYYEIEAGALKQEMNAGAAGTFLSWPVHMAAKSWIDYDAFLTAYLFALVYHASAGAYDGPVSPEILERSINLAQKKRAEAGAVRGTPAGRQSAPG